MKKLLFLFVFVLILSGCATYKFQKGTKPPFDKGYVASYEGNILPEYTIGKNNAVPADLSLAKERFNRRRLTVEKYYKDMGYIENRIKEVFWEPPVMIFNIAIGVFKLPYIIYSDHKYENDPKYREMITKRDEDEYQKEKARITYLKEELNKYIQKDLSQESATAVPEQVVKASEVTPVETQPVAENKTEPPKAVEKEEAAPKQVVKAPEPVPAEKQPAVENKTEAPKAVEEKEIISEQEVKAPEATTVGKEEKIENKIEPSKPAEKEEAAPEQEVKAPESVPVEKQAVVENKTEPSKVEVIKPVQPEVTEPAVTHQAPVTPEIPSPVAVILARPAKGFSPLKVDFYGTKSHSPNGRIVSYDWDFGDGDTSNKPKASNTYWSATYGARNFTVTLTVKDVKGATATTTQSIEVMNK